MHKKSESSNCSRILCNLFTQQARSLNKLLIFKTTYSETNKALS